MTNNLLSVVLPEVYAQLDFDKNATSGINVDSLSAGNHQKVWWRCSLGHSWDAVVYSRKNNGCAVCAGQRVQSGYNDLETAYPELIESWHPTLNGSLVPSETYKHSMKKIWWHCKHGHEWKTTAKHRTVRGSNCPVCTNRIVVAGFNDLASTNPVVAKQWHPSLNLNLTPEMLTAGSNKKVWWKCKNDHEYQSVISDRNVGKGCGTCANKVLLTGYNDLQTMFPSVASQWHPFKNDLLTAATVLAGSHKSVWWQCKDGHEWKTTIVSRTYGLKGCKYCAGQAAVVGINDLETLNPLIASQWNHGKNGSILLPSMVTVGSNQTVWWICEEGHEWSTTVNSRNVGNGCRICSGAGTSKTQMRWYDALIAHIPDLKHDERILVQWKNHKSMFVDMISVENNVIIEYDGWFYHSGERSGQGLEYHTAHDSIKTLALLDAGYNVIRIREGKLPHLAIQHDRLWQFSYKKGAIKGESIELILGMLVQNNKNH